MTVRALLLGLLLALLTAGLTYFNDQVIQNTFFIGNFLPVGVIGLVLFLVFLANPLVAALSRRSALSASEIALVAALGLAACAWPGSNFYRMSTGMTAMPNYLINFQTSWQASNLLSYVPGASHRLAPGQVKDWPKLIERIVDAPDDARRPAARIRELLEPAEREYFERLRGVSTITGEAARQMTQALNRVLASPDLYDPAYFREVEIGAPLQQQLEGLDSKDEPPAAHQLIETRRALLAAALPTLIAPAPEGMPLLVDPRGQEDRVMGPLLEGRPADQKLGLLDLPWDRWAPTAFLWTGIVLSFALMTVCLALIVHRQWSRNELLPYPIVRFLNESIEQSDQSIFPRIFHQRLFWVAFLFIGAIHLQNGLATWFEALPSYSMIIDLNPLKTIFTNAVQVPTAHFTLFQIPLIPSVIAFAFFLDARTSLSLGVANLLFVAFGALLIANGVAVQDELIGAENTNLMRAGAYLGFAAIIFYTGRRFYGDVFFRSLGLRNQPPMPTYLPWAGRGLLVGLILALAALSATGLPLFWSALLVVAVLLMFVVLGRIVAETGAFFLQAGWLPVGILTALFSFEAIGPTSFVILALTSILLAGDPRETLMPFILNGLKLTESKDDGQAPNTGRRGLALLGVVLISFFVAGAVTLTIQYNSGIQNVDNWANRYLPAQPFAALDRQVSELSARGTLSEVVAQAAANELPMPSPEEGTLFWMGLGTVFVLVFAVARLRFTWWPLHPLIFVLWGTHTMATFGGAFLIGWMIKSAVVKTTGAKGFHLLKPLMIGVVAAEVFAAICWGIVSFIYYLKTGLPPQTYRVFPR